MLGAGIKVPLPFVPITLQTFFVLLSGHLLGPVYGAASQIIYLLLGLAGLPVFAEGGGLAYIFKPTFGYLLGFPLASFMAGITVHRGVLLPEALPATQVPRLILANLSGLLAIFVPGVLYLWLNINFVLGQTLSFVHALQIGFLISLPGDVIKMAGVILLYLAIQPRLAGVAALPVRPLPTRASRNTIKIQT